MEARGKGRARGARRGAGPVPQPGQPQAGGAAGPPQPVPAPQGAWGRPMQSQPQPQVPTAWVRPPGQPPQMAGRGSRQPGPGGDERTHSVDPPKALGGDGDNKDGNGRRGGGNGGVRGRSNRSEIIRTRPEATTNKKGSTGHVQKLRANYFELISTGKWCLYQYRVDFSPEDDNTGRKKRLMRDGMRNVIPGGYLFDGSLMFTPVRLQNDPLEVVVQGENEERIRITVRLVGDVTWGDFHYLQLFNLIIKKCLSYLKLHMMNRNYYDAEKKFNIREHNLQLWPGYFTSIRQHERNILLNADIQFKVMRTDNVYDLLMECYHRGGNFKQVFRDHIIGAIVLTKYNNKTYRIDDVDFGQSPSNTFTKKDGSKITYIEYFKQTQQYTILNNSQPLLVSRSKAREIRAGMPEIVNLIPEMCIMTGLTDQQRDNIQLMQALAKHTRIPPNSRVQKLMEFIQRMGQNREVVDEIRRWDLKLADRLVEFDGRILPPEKIYLGNRAEVSAGEKADWTFSFRNNSMFRTIDMQNLKILCPRRAMQQCEEFKGVLFRCAKGLRWDLGRIEIIQMENDRVETYVNEIERVIQRNPQLIMCVAMRKATDIYTAIKKKTFVDRGVPSQVVCLRSMTSKGVMSIATKILIQINCKIGGAPWTVSVPLKNLMIVGYDVCRDTANKAKSFGAVVASLDQAGTKYYSGVSEHQSSEELSNNFAAFMIMACKKFKEHNNSYPERILVYRDGVGDGQLAYVYDIEVAQIKKRLSEEIYGGPFKMAFIVVSKRINTKIFLNDQNPPPGTVVDDVITLPERYDYFIVSQCVREGTVSPTNYNVIDDNLGLPPDRMQILTYKLCHQYYNWSGTVRVPAPCQYAHKLSQLVSQYLHRAPHRNLEDSLYYL